MQGFTCADNDGSGDADAFDACKLLQKQQQEAARKNGPKMRKIDYTAAAAAACFLESGAQLGLGLDTEY